MHTRDQGTNNFSLNQNVFLQILMLNKLSVGCTGGPWWTRTSNSQGPKKAMCSRASHLSAVELRGLAGSVSIGWSLKAVEMRDLWPVVEEWLGVAAGQDREAGLCAGSQGGWAGVGLERPGSCWGKQGG